MFHYVYKITNNVNGKFYIGIHSTENMNDGYMGSGNLIQLAIAKYGIENFSKEILHQLTSRSLALEKEREIVNKELIENKYCYNLCIGGRGPIGILRPLINQFHNNDYQYTVKTKKKIDLSEFYEIIHPTFQPLFDYMCNNFQEYLDSISLLLNTKGQHHNGEKALAFLVKKFSLISNDIFLEVRPWKISDKTAYAKSPKYNESQI